MIRAFCEPDHADAFAAFALGPDGPHWSTQIARRRYIVLHGSEGVDCKTILAHYARERHSMHYVIDTDGTLYQCVPETASAWTGVLPPVTGPDWYRDLAAPERVTFHILLIRGPGNDDTCPDAQVTTTCDLVTHLATRWQIPLQPADATGGVAAHSVVDTRVAQCPGPFPFERLFSEVFHESRESDDAPEKRDRRRERSTQVSDSGQSARRERASADPSSETAPDAQATGGSA